MIYYNVLGKFNIKGGGGRGGNIRGRDSSADEIQVLGEQRLCFREQGPAVTLWGLGFSGLGFRV